MRQQYGAMKGSHCAVTEDGDDDDGGGSRLLTETGEGPDVVASVP